jgi:methylated-DNA-protein-cysteine methyltransferase related protein
MQKSDIFEKVYDLVSLIPSGMVVTYGDIAVVVGINPRYVGYILHNNPRPGTIPCHRVVNSKGVVAANFAFGGGNSQRALLESEGIIFLKNKLKLSDYRYTL